MNNSGLTQLRQCTDSLELALKRQYLDGLAADSSTSASLRHVINRLLELDVTRKRLVQWAVEAGYSESYTRSILSRALRTSGRRVRRPGAGRRAPPEALALLAYARSVYGEKARKFLRAAYRAAEVETPANRVSRSLPNCGPQ